MIKQVKKFVNKFDNEVYVQYKSIIKDATSVSFSQDMEIVVKNKKQVIRYKPPVYKNIHTSIRKLYDDYNTCSTRYMVSGDKATLLEMNNILSEIDVLVYYYIVINYDGKSEIGKLLDQVNEIHTNLEDAEKTYKEILDLQDELFSKIKNIRALESAPVIDFYIESLPEKISEDVIKKQKVRREPNVIVKNMLKEFPFNKLPVQIKTIEECNTRSNKKPYYISLKDLISAIDNDDELKEIFGPKYKKMTKKELCDVIMK